MVEELYHLGIKALIKNSSGKILLLKVNNKLLKKTKGYNGEEYWDIPGGRVKKGDTPEKTLVKEVREELGNVKLNSVKHLGMFLSNIRIPVGNGHIGLILSIYTCKISAGKIKLNEENLEYRWFSPQTAKKLLNFKYPSEFTKLIRINQN